jgi:hypothetical protein
MPIRNQGNYKGIIKNNSATAVIQLSDIMELRNKYSEFI